MQNNVKKAENLGQSVAITSIAPISDNFGLQLSNIFDPVSNAVGAVSLPKFAGMSIVAPAQPAIEKRFNDGDQAVFDSNIALANKGGGTGYKASVVQPPNY